MGWRETSQEAIASAYTDFWMKLWQVHFQASCWNALQLLHQFRIYDSWRPGKLELDRWSLLPSHDGTHFTCLRGKLDPADEECNLHTQTRGSEICFWYEPSSWRQMAFRGLAEECAFTHSICSTSKWSLKSQKLRERSTRTPFALILL